MGSVEVGIDVGVGEVVAVPVEDHCKEAEAVGSAVSGRSLMFVEGRRARKPVVVAPVGRPIGAGQSDEMVLALLESADAVAGPGRASFAADPVVEGKEQSRTETVPHAENNPGKNGATEQQQEGWATQVHTDLLI